MNKRFMLAALAVPLLATACSSRPKSDIGLVDVQRVVANWPKFQNYENQLNADAATVQQSRASAAQKQREMNALRQRFANNQTELTNDVRNAATQVAGDRHLKYVLTQQFVGYGGVDITPDVEKVLQIVEKATPAP
jgi:Skp family chaperone for outer membrane proteins